MAENKITNELARTFEVEMPFANTQTEYLDQIIPIVRQWGEDLREDEFYENRPWLEVSDRDDFRWIYNLLTWRPRHRKWSSACRGRAYWQKVPLVKLNQVS